MLMESIARMNADDWQPKLVTEKPRKRRSNCIGCNLRQIMICADVSATELSDFHTWIDDLAPPPGETLFKANSPADGIYCIRAGIVKLVRLSKSGTPRIVRIAKHGDVIGLDAVFSESFEHTAIAVSEVRACKIPLMSLNRMLTTNVNLHRRLFERSQLALREAETWLSELAGGTAQARERMARLLLRMREGSTNRIFRFSLEDIGAMLGITVETASRILSDFSKQGILTKKQSHASEIRYYSADIGQLEQISDGIGPEPAFRTLSLAV